MNRLWLLLAMMLGFCLGACGPEPVKKCDAATCAGCCAESGECLSGAELSACGATGAQCMTCAANEQCAAGACVRFDGGLYDASFGDDPDANYNRDAGLFDAGPMTDAGRDGGADAGADAGRADGGADAGRADSGVDAGRSDSGVTVDAGADAGRDGGADAGRDAGTDAGADAGP